MATEVISRLVRDIPLPPMLPLRQRFYDERIPEAALEAAVFRALDESFGAALRPGMSVAITGGSRGIAHIDRITKAIVDYAKQKGAAPFLFAAMGSHGGATDAGQLAVLESFNLTEGYLGCPVRSSMEVSSLGRTPEGVDVYLDKLSTEADATILCNRVKPHTDFRGDYESGLVKMAVIGMGKQIGADAAHETGFRHFPTLLPQMGRYILEHSNIIGGLAIVENGLEQTAGLYGLTPEAILAEEPRLLAEARSYMPQILLDDLDVLIIGRAGKNVSGNGIDPNVTGRFTIPELSQEKAKRIGILELTEETHGNFNGIGLADLITRRLYEQCDLEATYPNAFTSTVLGDVKLPFMVASDRECFQVAIKTCNGIDRARPRVVYIQDTLHLEHILISEALLEEAKQNPRLQPLGPARPIAFDARGNMEKEMLSYV